jgi:hypothetical protein
LIRPAAIVPAAVVIAALLSSSAAMAGSCVQQGDGLRCFDGMETLVFQGILTGSHRSGETMTLQSDGQGNTYGMIGSEKLMIIRSGGMGAAKLGNRRMVCVEGGTGVTVCK